MIQKLLGIDVGTGGTRVVLVDSDGRVLHSATTEHAPIFAAHIGWAEQQPADWWRAACASVRACLGESHTNPSEITGIGLSGQMHGLVLLDASGDVLRPSIIWCDQRTDEAVQSPRPKNIVGATVCLQLTCESCAHRISR